MGYEDYKFDPEIKNDNFINTLKQKLGISFHASLEQNYDFS